MVMGRCEEMHLVGVTSRLDGVEERSKDTRGASTTPGALRNPALGDTAHGVTDRVPAIGEICRLLAEGERPLAPNGDARRVVEKGEVTRVVVQGDKCPRDAHNETCRLLAHGDVYERAAHGAPQFALWSRLARNISGTGLLCASGTEILLERAREAPRTEMC